MTDNEVTYVKIKHGVVNTYVKLKCDGRWREVELALTDELVNALREAIQSATVTNNTIDFNKQRIEAYRRFIERRCVFSALSGDHKMDVGAESPTFKETSVVFLPQDYNTLIKELELIDRIEAETKREEE